MKKAIFIFLCFCSVGYGQNKQIDSLINVLKTAKEDTNKVNTQNALSDILEGRGEYKKAKEYAGDALLLSEKLNYKKGKASAYGNFGIICIYEGNYKDALNDYSIKLETSEEISDKCGAADGYYGIGRAYYFQGKRTESYKNFFASLKLMEETGNKHGIAMCYIMLRNVDGNYSHAMKSLLSAFEIVKETDDKPGLIECYMYIGSHYQVLANYSDARKNYSEALKNYLASLKIAEEIGDKRNIAGNYDNIAEIYSLENNYDEASKFSFDALKIEKEIGDKQGILNSYNILGAIYTKARRFADAGNYIYSALALSKEMNDEIKTKGIYEDLIRLDTAMGNYKKALTDYNTYYSYTDSLFMQIRTRQIAEMQAQYESEKKEKEIALLTKDNEIKMIEIERQKQQKYSFIGGLTLIILLMLFGYRTYRGRQILRLQHIRNKIASDLHDDIGSTLNSISVYSEVARNNQVQRDEALEMIGDSSRKIIDTMSDIVWTINPENDSFTKTIFRMKSLAHNLLRAKNIEYTFHADETLEDKKLSLEDRRNFYLIFKEAINNIIKYSDAMRVAITLSNESDSLKLSIKDNGLGFDISAENAGNGLKSMKRRADEMKAKFKIESEKGSGTKIELILAA